MRAWAKINNDRMKVSIGRQLGVHLRPRFTNMAVHPNCQGSVWETDSQTSTRDPLGAGKYVCTGSSTWVTHLGLRLRGPGQVTSLLCALFSSPEKRVKLPTLVGLEWGWNKVKWDDLNSTMSDSPPISQIWRPNPRKLTGLIWSYPAIF